MARPVRCPALIEVAGRQWWEWPECGWFLAQPWQHVHPTQDGTQYTWGGICKRHGEVSDGT